jgi:AraC-like DNA-binding protein
MSARSLQRRLREHGCTFATLSDEVRAATARLYLDQPDMALAEIAHLLGFADQPAFTKAFKRWTGSTPSQARLRAGRSKADGP